MLSAFCQVLSHLKSNSLVLYWHQNLPVHSRVRRPHMHSMHNSTHPAVYSSMSQPLTYAPTQVHTYIHTFTHHTHHPSTHHPSVHVLSTHLDIIYPYYKYLRSTHCVPGTVLGARNTSANTVRVCLPTILGGSLQREQLRGSELERLPRGKFEQKGCLLGRYEHYNDITMDFYRLSTPVHPAPKWRNGPIPGNHLASVA